MAEKQVHWPVKCWYIRRRKDRTGEPVSGHLHKSCSIYSLAFLPGTGRDLGQTVCTSVCVGLCVRYPGKPLLNPPEFSSSGLKQLKKKKRECGKAWKIRAPWESGMPHNVYVCVCTCACVCVHAKACFSLCQQSANMSQSFQRRTILVPWVN